MTGKKRITAAALCAALCASCLFSCVQAPDFTAEKTVTSEKNATAEKTVPGANTESGRKKTKNDKFDPSVPFPVSDIIKIGIPVSAAGKPTARFFTLDDGVAYLTKADSGYAAGYFNLEKSILAERIAEDDTATASDVFRLFQTGSSTAIALWGRKVFYISLNESSFRSAELPESVTASGADLSRAILYSGTKVLYENSELILTALVDFETQYVLCRKSALGDFGGVICISDDEKKIYYAEKSGDSYKGYAYFEYGKSEPLGRTSLEFDSYKYLGDGKTLFCSSSGLSRTFTFADLYTGEKKTVTASSSVTAYDYICDREGNYLFVLCGDALLTDGAEIWVYDLDRNVRIYRGEIKNGPVNKNIALTPDASGIVFSRYSDGEDGSGELVCIMDASSLWK